MVYVVSVYINYCKNTNIIIAKYYLPQIKRVGIFTDPFYFCVLILYFLTPILALYK